jgi:hypothetical protein
MGPLKRPPARSSLRLRVADRQVTEVEWILTRMDEDNIINADGFIAKPPPQGPVSTEQRTPREDLLAAGKSYHDGISTYNWSLIRSCPDCYRIENGYGQPGGVREGTGVVGLCNDFTADGKAWPVPILDRHYFADEDAGIVWINAIFKAPFPSYKLIRAGQVGDIPSYKPAA